MFSRLKRAAQKVLPQFGGGGHGFGGGGRGPGGGGGRPGPGGGGRPGPGGGGRGPGGGGRGPSGGGDRPGPGGGGGRGPGGGGGRPGPGGGGDRPGPGGGGRPGPGGGGRPGPFPGPGRHWPMPIHGGPGHGVWGRPWGWNRWWHIPVLMSDGRYSFSGANIGDQATLENLISQLSEYFGLALQGFNTSFAPDGQTIVSYTVYGWDVNIDQFVTQLNADAPGTEYSAL